jgi:hypothetical protein
MQSALYASWAWDWDSLSVMQSIRCFECVGERPLVEEKHLKFGAGHLEFTVSAQYMPICLFWHMPKFSTFHYKVFSEYLYKSKA